MKFFIRWRSLVAASVVVLAPLSVLWLNGATAQDNTPRHKNPHSIIGRNLPGKPVASPPAGNAAGNFVYVNSDPRSQADYEHDAQMRKLLADYSQTEDEKQRAKVLDELTKVVSEQFDARQEVRERELKELEEQVRKLRDLQQRRAKEKDQIIRDRVRQLLRDVDGLGWGDEVRAVEHLMPVTVPRPSGTPARR